LGKKNWGQGKQGGESVRKRKRKRERKRKRKRERRK